jgi:GNAT superfamily N-acetyltransferase
VRESITAPPVFNQDEDRPGTAAPPLVDFCRTVSCQVVFIQPCHRCPECENPVAFHNRWVFFPATWPAVTSPHNGATLPRVRQRDKGDAVQIREFSDDDWPSVWPIFQEVVSAGDTYAYDSTWSSEQARNIWVEAPPGHIVVACDGPRVLGTAKMGPNRPGPGSHVATASFMVAADARGRGVGRALGEYVLSWAKQQGYAAMQFNAVVASNHVAVRLWQELGFQIVPEAFAHPTLGRVGLHIMHRFL